MGQAPSSVQVGKCNEGHCTTKIIISIKCSIMFFICFVYFAFVQFSTFSSGWNSVEQAYNGRKRVLKMMDG